MRKYLYILCIVFATQVMGAKAQVIDTVQIYAQHTAYQTKPNPGSSYTWWVEDGQIVGGQGTNLIYVNWLDITGLKKITLTETALGNCVLEPVLAYVLVNEKDTAFMPNAFTPNKDGLNESFKPITNWNLVEAYQLRIFNRWGLLVYETTEIGKGWDGKYSNGSYNSEVFLHMTYIAFKSGKNYYKQGNFTLLE